MASNELYKFYISDIEDKKLPVKLNKGSIEMNVFNVLSQIISLFSSFAT